ncbi:HlyD family efflux transporter periplasmic adaptor subunit [Corynebacterium sp. H130]|uniref:HlyD family efflux transporter periplasmic adaptor subunit n=1 Tax=Corynebacterium sp. H130 TaxID=3133444 RepID=UPI00309C391B
MTPLSRPKKRTAIIAGATAAALVTAGGGAYAMFGSGGKDDIVMASDTVQIEQRDVEEKVHASGDLVAHRSTSITSRLTGPVKNLKVKLGDHVQAEQLLAEMDTTGLQRQLELELANREATATANSNALQAEQQAYDQLRQQYDQGATPEITAAITAQRQAESALHTATQAFENKRKDSVAGTDPALREQYKALQTARDEQHDAALNLAKVNAATLFGVVVSDVTGPDGLFDAVATQDRLNRADRDLAEKQRDYEQSLVEVDRELAELQTKVRDAEAAHSDAVIGTESARLIALHNIDKQRGAVERAQATVNTGTAASDLTAQHLSVDLSQAEIRSPHGGVVTELTAKEGAPSEGVLMTVADDSRLLITTKIKEADRGKIKPGTEVSFTTPSDKDKTFKGRVSHVAAVATNQAEEGGKSKREFPVEITVEGDTEGLNIGATAKIEFLVNKEASALAVPRESVLKSPEGYAVIALVPDGDKHRVTKISVTVKAQNDFDAAIAALDVEEGTKIMTDPTKHVDDVDKLVRVKG